MSCDDKKLKYLKEIKEGNVENLPQWFRVFLEGSSDVQPINCGGYKIVYPYKDHAVSIERGDKRMDPTLLTILKLMPAHHQKHLIYPLESFYSNNFTVSKMSLCPHGDLYDIIQSKEKLQKLEMSHLVELAATLDALHSKNIAIIDLKLENIMMCTCNCLAFIDLDSALSLSEQTKIKSATPWWNPIILLPGVATKTSYLKPRDCFISDWASFALVTLFFVASKLWWQQRMPVLYNMLNKSSDANDFSYMYLRYSYLLNYVFEDTLSSDLKDSIMYDTDIVEAPLDLLYNLIEDRRAPPAKRRFSSKAGALIIRFQEALGLQSTTNNGRFRLQQQALKF